MKLEQQVISLDLAKRLKELGVKQESLVTWVQSTEGDQSYKLISFKEFYGAHNNYFCAGFDDEAHPMYAAFTVAELGELMKGKGMGVTAHSGLGTANGWWVRGGEWIVEKQQYSHLVHGQENWAEALGLMLEYLITNKLLGV